MLGQLIFVLHVAHTLCVWFPEYQEHYSKIEDYIVDTEDDAELILDADISSMNLKTDDSKFQRLHRDFKHQNSEQERKILLPKDENIYSWRELDQRLREKHSITTIADEDVNEYEVEAHQHIQQPETSVKPSETYDYYALKAEYYHEADEMLHSNKSFNYSQQPHTEDQQPHTEDVVQEILSIKKPKNCTKEENSNFGIRSLECLWDDFKKKQTKVDRMKLIKRLLKIIMIWILIYALIAIPCWCQRGWCCCCCCCCRICRPRRVLDDAKRFVMTNPPGVYVKGKRTYNYNPTEYETQAYNNLMHAVRNI